MPNQHRIQFSVDKGHTWSNTSFASHVRNVAEAGCEAMRKKHEKELRVAFRVTEEPARTLVSDAQVNAYCAARDKIRFSVCEQGSFDLGYEVEAATVLLWQMLQSGYAGPFPVLPCRDYEPAEEFGWED